MAELGFKLIVVTIMSGLGFCIGALAVSLPISLVFTAPLYLGCALISIAIIRDA